MLDALTNLQAWWNCQVMMATGTCGMCTTDMPGCC